MRNAAQGEYGDIMRWPVPKELTESPAVEYRNMFARELGRRPVVHLVESYVYMDPPQMSRLVRLAATAVGMQFGGTGLEVGAGCGLLSSTIAHDPAVEKIYSLEVCEELAKLIYKVSDGVLGSKASKVVPVVGSFDDIRLPDESVDFVVEIDSLHHSDDLKRTLRECFRVLRPRGTMLLLDRCHPNTVTDEQVEAMLNIVYSREFLKYNCYPTDVVLTRRQNGEHEYRLYEWQDAFRAAGFDLVRAKRFIGGVRLATAVKPFLGFLPRKLRRRLYKTENQNFRGSLEWVRQRLTLPFKRTDLGRPGLAPRETTAFLIRKP